MAFAGNDTLNDSLVQCAICFEDMSEVIICPAGHSLCKSCFNKMSPHSCPFCKTSMVGCTRNKAIEKLIGKLRCGNLNKQLNDSVTLCSQCSKFMETQIGVCKSGHSSCNDCMKKNKTCKICLAKITIERNFLLESCIKRIKNQSRMRASCCQLFGASSAQSTTTKTIICPLPDCSFKGLSISDHIINTHKRQTSIIQPNCLLRLCVRNFCEKNFIFRMIDSSTEKLFVTKIKVSHTFMMIHVQQLTNGGQHKLHIENNGTHDIGMYKFKYTNNSNTKKITLRTESLQLSKIGEYVVKLSIFEPKK